MQDAFQASMEAQRLAYEQNQQMVQQARRQAELSASRAREQAELQQAEAMYHRERAAELDRQAEIARSQAATFGQERERGLVAAEIRRAEAEVRRQAAEQRRQAAERSRQAVFGAPLERDPSLESEPVCSGFVEGEVWDEQGNVTWVSKLCGHERCRMGDRGGNSSQAVCPGYVDQEVTDEQGNSKWISRLCGHEECGNLFR
jgi:hypothetical protein